MPLPFSIALKSHLKLKGKKNNKTTRKKSPDNIKRPIKTTPFRLPCLESLELIH